MTTLSSDRLTLYRLPSSAKPSPRYAAPKAATRAVGLKAQRLSGYLQLSWTALQAKFRFRTFTRSLG